MGRRVLITGGGRGIGAGVTRELVAAGHAALVVAHRSTEDASRLCDELNDRHGAGSAQWVACDLADAEALEAFCSTLEARHGDFDGLVHCAGVSQDSLAAVAPLDVARNMMQINYWAFVQLYQALVRPMSLRRYGRILCIGSVAAELGMRGNALYAGSKAALLGFMRSSMTEIAGRNITINCIEPGFIDTRLLADYETRREAIQQSIPVGRYGTPQEVAGLAALLFSPAGAYITGQALVVDGGLSRGMAR